jgi:hypothetical protein
MIIQKEGYILVAAFLKQKATYLTSSKKQVDNTR